MAIGYEVISDELTVLRTVSKLPQSDGSTLYQNGLGRTYLRGEVVAPENVAEDWKEALSSGEGLLFESLATKLRPVSAAPREDSPARLGLPFVGYEGMSEEEIIAALRVLPSATIQRVKEYESQSGNRTAIVDYSIGYGEHPDDRQNATVEVGELDEGKVVRGIKTRSVPDSGPVEHGEGFTGTGEPQKEYGSEAASGDSEVVEEPKGNIAAARKGRRERGPATK